MLLLTTTSRTLRALLAALALVLLAAACTGGEEEPEATATLEETAEEPSSEEEDASPSPSPSPSARPSPSPSEVALPEEFEQDSDGNAIPDFLEESVGYDPLTDDCILRTCPGAEGLDPTATGSLDQNVMLLLDASGSMAGPDGSGAVKIDAARSALERYAFGVPPNFRLGLEVFGHRGSNQESGKAESCAGIDIVSPLGSLTADSAAGALNQFQPTGYTPLAAALQRAAEAFAGTEGAGNRVILVTDGIETCEGDPVAAAAALQQAGIAVTVDVVGFDVQGESDRAALQAIADATGGTYTDARDAALLDSYFDGLLAESAAIMDTYVCVGASLNEVQTCTSQLRFAAQEELFRLANEQEDLELGGLYREYYNDTLLPGYNQQVAAIDTLRTSTLSDLLNRFNEVKRRYEERYGRPVAYGPLCSDDLVI